MKWFKVAAVAAVFLVSMAAAAWFWTGMKIQERAETRYVPAPLGLSSYQADLQLGERIAQVRSGCVDCHGADFGGKTVVDDPAMGRIDAPNITPTGLAKWSDEEVATAIRNCVKPDGRPLFFMPCMDFVGLSGGDLASLVGYLRTLPSVTKERGPIRLGPIGRLLVALDKIPHAYAADRIDIKSPLSIKPAEDVTPEFGRYLAAACKGCHGLNFKGGKIEGGPPDWPPAPDLTPAALRGWSLEDFARALKEGTSKDGRKLKPPFPIGLTSQMNAVEIEALWKFFQTVPQRPLKEL